MKKKLAVLLAVLVLVLWGCGQKEQPEPSPMTEMTEAVIPPTTPPDGNPKDVTCKGSYTGSVSSEEIARTGDAALTNAQLQSWYWAAAAQYQAEGHGAQPDFTQPLDTQSCEVDSSVNSWQQYFLRQALENWHRAQSLYQDAQIRKIPTEPEYRPDLEKHAAWVEGKPATRFLYGYDKTYRVNTMHQAYLDAIPQLLETLAKEKGYETVDAMAQAMGTNRKDLEEFVWLYNYGYTYLTYRSDDLIPSDEEVAPKEAGEIAVELLQVLCVPEDSSAEALAACESKARKLLRGWEKGIWTTEATFSVLAHDNSQDTSTACVGGRYRNLRKGQMPEAVESWCFDARRKPGDTTILHTEQGVHILYFVKAEAAGAGEELLRQREEALLAEAGAAYPMTVDYGKITLSQGEPVVSFEEVLYPDVAHERYPEVPLYLQDDYPTARYGGYSLAVQGCGISDFAMLTSYMTDTQWTPIEMSAIYGRYSHDSGTDGMIYINEPANFGYFFLRRTFNPEEAKAALEEGHVLVSVQHKGDWTSGGHYILLEKMTEDGKVQVRDSSLKNYGRLSGHAEDKHPWKSVTSSSGGYWIFDKKVTRTPACFRCGQPGDTQLAEHYLCRRCELAKIRRSTYLNERTK